MLVPCITSSYETYFINYIPRLNRLTEILTQYNQSVSRSKQFDITLIQPMIHDYSLNHQRYQSLALRALKGENVATDNHWDNFITLAIMLEHVLEVYQQQQLSLDIFHQTISDLFLRFNQSNPRGITSADFPWLMQIFKFRIFKLGELQFEFTHFRPETLPDNTVFRSDFPSYLLPKDPIISVHIMEGSRIHPNQIRHEFDLAREFKARYFPELTIHYFYCYSWLLYPNNAQFMAPTSNILAFMRLFEIIAQANWPNMSIERIFGDAYIEAIDQPLPQQTSLQKAASQHLDQLGVGVGVIAY